MQCNKKRKKRETTNERKEVNGSKKEKNAYASSFKVSVCANIVDDDDDGSFASLVRTDEDKDPGAPPHMMTLLESCTSQASEPRRRR